MVRYEKYCFYFSIQSANNYVWCTLSCDLLTFFFYFVFLDIVNARRFARPSSTLLIIDNVDHSRSLEGAVAAAVDAGVISIVGGETGACRYGSVHAYYH